jgi:hypothetical protein
MNEQAKFHGALAALSLLAVACGGPVQSGVAVGKVGQGLTGHARAIPQAAEACALTEALAALPGSEKSFTDACGKAARNDQMWRRAMVVLGAYGQTLESLASGSGGDNAGRLEAALTGVSGSDWASVDGPTEQAARDAATALVNQMGAVSGDLSRTIKDAAPHVKTICEGLEPYLEAQVKAFGEVEKDAEKRRSSHTDRRCGSVSGTNICVSESPIDRMLYGSVFAQASLMESAHRSARDSVASFCAAHRKLDSAAASGDLGKDKTYVDIVAAVKSVQQAPSAAPDPKAKKK